MATQSDFNATLTKAIQVLLDIVETAVDYNMTTAYIETQESLGSLSKETVNHFVQIGHTVVTKVADSLVMIRELLESGIDSADAVECEENKKVYDVLMAMLPETNPNKLPPEIQQRIAEHKARNQ